MTEAPALLILTFPAIPVILLQFLPLFYPLMQVKPISSLVLPHSDSLHTVSPNYFNHRVIIWLLFSAVTSSPPPLPSAFPSRPEFVSDRLVHQYYSPPVFVSSHADRSLCPITLQAWVSPGKPKPASHLDLQASGPKSSCTFLHFPGFAGTIEEIKAADKSRGCHELGKKKKRFPPPLK